MNGFSLRPYAPADQDACLALFDANCPAFFAPNERDDYLVFLNEHAAVYEVCLHDLTIAGAFGLIVDANQQRGRLSWIMLDPSYHGKGLGSQMMQRVHDKAQHHDLSLIDIAASQHSEAFFARFGAKALKTTPHGWGPGMHRVDMSWRVTR